MLKHICEISKHHELPQILLSQRFWSRNLSSANGEKYFDVVIAGGGMVGTSLACALGSSPQFQDQKVCLLEAMSEHPPKNWKAATLENRVSAITPGSKVFLKGIGVWERITQKRYHPFHKMHVWDSCSSGNISFNSYDINEDHIAYMIENSVIVESCTEVVKELTPISLQYNSKISEISFPDSTSDEYFEDLVTIQLENGDQIKTKLLVGADGFNSFVRTKAQLETYSYDYNQSAVVATLKMKQQDSTNQTAWQRFLPTGPIAILPISNTHSNLVWSTSKDQAKELLNLSEEEFINKIIEALHHPPAANFMLDAASSVMKAFISTVSPGKFASSFLNTPPHIHQMEPNSRAMFPLALKHALHYVKSRTVLVGDAAHRIHPMAGQGVNLGFGDASSLVKVLEESVSDGKDHGVLENLFAYESDRQRYAVTMISAINALNTLFSTKQFPLVFARSIGLQTTDVISPVKDRIIKYAMG